MYVYVRLYIQPLGRIGIGVHSPPGAIELKVGLGGDLLGGEVDTGREREFVGLADHTEITGEQVVGAIDGIFEAAGIRLHFGDHEFSGREQHHVEEVGAFQVLEQLGLYFIGQVVVVDRGDGDNKLPSFDLAAGSADQGTGYIEGALVGMVGGMAVPVDYGGFGNFISGRSLFVLLAADSHQGYDGKREYFFHVGSMVCID